MSLKRTDSTSSELNDFAEGPDGKKEYVVSRSRLARLIDWYQALKSYLPVLVLLATIGLVVQISLSLHMYDFDVNKFVNKEVGTWTLPSGAQAGLLQYGWQPWALAAILLWYLTHIENPVFLIDFTTFEAPDSWRVTYEEIAELMEKVGVFNEESLEFMKRMVKQSGTGPATAWPPAVTGIFKGEGYKNDAEESRKESQVIIFDCVRRLLNQNKVNPKSIDILVINCSLFNPTPSFCTMVINEFGFRSDVISYNLSGMGCSAGLISIDLVRNILKGRPNSTALVVSTEIITPNLYLGNEKSFLLQNMLFRCGGAAILLSNKWMDAYRARFKLLHCVRTQTVGEDSLGCVYETIDSAGRQGVRLSKDIVKVAGRAMEKNLTALGPLVLPFSEQFKVVFWLIVRFIFKSLSGFGIKLPKVTPYIPDFKKGVDYFCIHAGGRGVIDGIEKNLNLTPSHVEASRYTLYTYGNTSSSSIWYEMQYVCNRMNLKWGQRVMQLAFGSGFKCNSAVWLSLSSNQKRPEPVRMPFSFDEYNKMNQDKKNQ